MKKTERHINISENTVINSRILKTIVTYAKVLGVDQIGWVSATAAEISEGGETALTIGHFGRIIKALEDIRLVISSPQSAVDEKRERTILKKANELRALTKNRPDYDPEEFISNVSFGSYGTFDVDLAHLSATAAERLTEARKTRAFQKRIGNRSDPVRFIYWILLMEFWRHTLGRTVGVSRSSINGVEGGPLVRFISAMSREMPTKEAKLTNGAIANFVRDHKDVDCSPSASMRQIWGLHEGRIFGSS